MIAKPMERMVCWSDRDGLDGDGVGVKHHDAALYKLRYMSN
jgi:hypothetical protein